MPDYFRDMANVTLALVSHADNAAARTYLLTIAERYGELAEEAEQAYAPFEPAAIYGECLYLGDQAASHGEFSVAARGCPEAPLLVTQD